MSRLITKGNLAIFEYPEGATPPEFTLEPNGVLWIFGYLLPVGNHSIRSAKRYETHLVNYTVVGDYEHAKKIIQGDFSELITDVDTANCVVLAKAVK